MKKLLRSLAILSLGLILTTGIQSCKKDKDDTTLDDIMDTKDNALAEGHDTDVENMSDEAMSGTMTNFREEGEYSLLSGCATITKDTTVTPKMMTIDFGSTNCLCRDGRYRRGKVIVTWTGQWRTPGAAHTISYNNYFVNDNQLLGTKTRRFDGPDGDGNFYWDVTVNGKMVPAGTADTVRWNANRRVTWVQGYSTAVRSDDVFLITGGSTGTGRTGLTWTTTIINPLRKEVGCRWIVSGIREVTRADKPTRRIDYGNGACDNVANVTVNGNTRQITLW
jgi:hypothetical protein